MSDSQTKILAKEWNRSGIHRGDTVLIHSSASRTLRQARKIEQDFGPLDLLNSFLEAVGPYGTVMLPLFNFHMAEGCRFDVQNTPSEMGSLTEAARLHPDAVRTLHPMYSFAVIGNKSRYFKNLQNFSGYGSDSPFAMLKNFEGKIASLDLPDENCMTFYHHVEEMLEVNYRYHKTFKGTMVDSKNMESNVEFGLFVRKIEDGIVTDVKNAGLECWKKGYCKGHHPKEGNGLKTIDANRLYDFTKSIIQRGDAERFLYRKDRI